MPNADHAALLAAVKDRPHDTTPKLVLADWYDDHGMSSHAQVWRHFGGHGGEDNVRAKAFAATEGTNNTDRTPLTTMLGKGVAQHDPESAARHHLSMAAEHLDRMGYHEEIANDENYADHERRDNRHLQRGHETAAAAHTEAAHALSPGVKAHAATEAVADAGYGGSPRFEEARRFSRSTTVRPTTAKAGGHETAARLLTRYADEVPDGPVRGKLQEAAGLHREAAAHYAALQGL